MGIGGFCIPVNGIIMEYKGQKFSVFRNLKGIISLGIQFKLNPSCDTALLPMPRRQHIIPAGKGAVRQIAEIFRQNHLDRHIRNHRAFGSEAMLSGANGQTRLQFKIRNPLVGIHIKISLVFQGRGSRLTAFGRNILMDFSSDIGTLSYHQTAVSPRVRCMVNKTSILRILGFLIARGIGRMAFPFGRELRALSSFRSIVFGPVPYPGNISLGPRSHLVVCRICSQIRFQTGLYCTVVPGPHFLHTGIYRADFSCLLDSPQQYSVPLGGRIHTAPVGTHKANYRIAIRFVCRQFSVGDKVQSVIIGLGIAHIIVIIRMVRFHIPVIPAGFILFDNPADIGSNSISLAVGRVKAGGIKEGIVKFYEHIIG